MNVNGGGQGGHEPVDRVVQGAAVAPPAFFCCCPTPRPSDGGANTWLGILQRPNRLTGGLGPQCADGWPWIDANQVSVKLAAVGFCKVLGGICDPQPGKSLWLQVHNTESSDAICETIEDGQAVRLVLMVQPVDQWTFLGANEVWRQRGAQGV